MTILAGDIGGTKANLALYEMEAGGLTLIEGQRYTSHDYESLELLIEAFIAGRQREIRAACFGIPGAVIDGEARLPNLPWLVSREKLAAALSL
ncbi:MAG: glucokinase, partial [Acidobacteria bacterium]|nr:glucokinase [Acidobacteriota bacterium]